MHFNSSLTLLNEDSPFLLEKRIKLLQAIKEVGSISKAAKMVPMSYKSAWDAIDSINNLSSQLIVKKETGGVGGGGAKVTSYGEKILESYLILKKEHEKFLKQLTLLTDFQTGELKDIQRLNMQISARNQIHGIIEEITTNEINANIKIKSKSGNNLFANVSKDSLEILDLKLGSEIIALFKSNNVLLSKQEDILISARNQITGTIVSIKKDTTNSEILIKFSESETITSVVTTQAVEKLNLQIDDKITAYIKASDILIGK